MIDVPQARVIAKGIGPFFPLTLLFLLDFRSVRTRHVPFSTRRKKRLKRQLKEGEYDIERWLEDACQQGEEHCGCRKLGSMASVQRARKRHNSQTILRTWASREANALFLDLTRVFYTREIQSARRSGQEVQSSCLLFHMHANHLQPNDID
jgi:hypothetical protein